MHTQYRHARLTPIEPEQLNKLKYVAHVPEKCATKDERLDKFSPERNPAAAAEIKRREAVMLENIEALRAQAALISEPAKIELQSEPHQLLGPPRLKVVQGVTVPDLERRTIGGTDRAHMRPLSQTAPVRGSHQSRQPWGVFLRKGATLPKARIRRLKAELCSNLMAAASVATLAVAPELAPITMGLDGLPAVH
jgi:hypothetical protein